MRLRSISGIALGVAITLAFPIVLGCDGGGSSRAPRAGSEPIPSSDRQVSVPASSSAPRYTGPPAGPPKLRPGQRPGGLFGQALAEEERLFAQKRGPERLEDPEAEGRRIAMEMMERMRRAEAEARAEHGAGDDAERGPCDDAWITRIAQGRHLGRDTSSLPAQRREFMARCRALPEPMRNCMSPTYQSAHAQECAELQERAARPVAREAGVTIPR